MNTLFEDNYLLVIDKPSGMVVNKAETTKGQETVQEWASSVIPSPLDYAQGKLESRDLVTTEEFYSRSGIVHRLDKETSGVLVIAKTPESFAALKQQFMQRQVKKIYLALVHGRVAPEEGVISVPVGRLPYNRMRFGVLPGGRESYTEYKTTMNYTLKTKNKIEELSFLELYPKTGRTHQIRIHLQYIHHPIFGDALYAGRKTARDDRKLLPRIFLHASKLTFYHPLSGKEMTIIAEMPKKLKEFLGTLKAI